MTDKEFFSFLRNHFSNATTAREATLNNAIVNRLNSIEEKVLAFKLINEKRVDIKVLHWAYPSCEAYNVWVREHMDSFPRAELTQEEFEFIGRKAGAK